MKYKVLIVDDEEDARELLKIHLNRHPNFEIIGEGQNGKEALLLMKRTNPDVVFIDIQMPEMNGIEVIERATSLPCFVFVTAYDEFAIKAFELNALDYLLKPLAASRFDQTIERVLEKLQSDDIQDYKEQVWQVSSSISKPSTYLQRFAYKSGLKTTYIPVTYIVLITAADQYVEIHTASKKYLLRLSMDYLERTLDPSLFFRSHRSSIVKVSEVISIEYYESKNYIVHLSSNLKAKLTKERRELLNELLTLG